MQRIVVGIDGSENSRRALEWALTEAKLRSVRLTLVSAWQVPKAILSSPVAMAAYDDEVWRSEATDALNAALESVDLNDLPAGLDREVVEGPPAQVLLDTSSDADLIVVGSRGRGGFAGLLLGSVSQQVAHQSRCPVVIVPPDR